MIILMLRIFTLFIAVIIIWWRLQEIMGYEKSRDLTNDWTTVLFRSKYLQITSSWFSKLDFVTSQNSSWFLGSTRKLIWFDI